MLITFIAFFEFTKDNIELIYTNSYKRYCYHILTNFMIDYKKQVFITGIKLNIQWLIYYSLPKKES